MKKKCRLHLHPYLIGIFPVISLYAHNQSQLQANIIWRSLIVVISGTTIIFIALRLYFGDWDKAALTTSYVSLIFFLYTPLRELAYNIRFLRFSLGWDSFFSLFGYLFLFQAFG